jgi:peptidoglycan/LPS O-acetylase OafA/YrhL
MKAIPALTGIRAIAAYMVFFHHLNPFKDIDQINFLFGIVNELHVGVTVFFVLSGYLIGRNYLFQNNFDSFKFIKKRIIRIYPTYIIILFTEIVLGREPIELMNILMNITLLKGYFNPYKFSGIGQSWSLSVEESFYFFFAYFKTEIQYRTYLYFFFIALSILGIGLILTKFIFSKYYFEGFICNYNLLLSYTIFGRSFEFISGILLAKFLYEEKLISKIRYINITYLGCFMFAVCVLILKSQNPLGQVGKLSNLSILVNNFFLPLFAIIPLLYGLIKENTVLNKILSTDLVQLLGKSSYVFYLIHIGAIATTLDSLIGNNIFVKFIVMNIISVLFYQFLENPLHLFLKDKLIKQNVQ